MKTKFIAFTLTALILSSSLQVFPINVNADETENELTIYTEDETDDTDIQKTGFVKINEDYYYIYDDGTKAVGRVIIDNMEYTFDDEGKYIEHHIQTDYVNSDDMLTYDELAEILPKLKEHYPELCDYTKIGKTIDNRYIYDFIIGNKNADKQLVFIGAIHAREYITSLLLMENAEYLLNSCYTRSRHGVLYKDILSEYAIHIIPMANPDGVTISELGPKAINNETIQKNLYTIYKNDTIRKYTDYSEERYFQRWKANARGVDLNRNFDAKWDIIETLKGKSGLNYKGEKPESEREVRYILNFIRSLSNPQTVVSYHATGSMIYWDYGQEGSLRERSVKQIELVSELTGYKALDYSEKSAGGLSDYIAAHPELDIVPETIEVGVSEAPVSMEEYDNIYSENKFIMISLAELYMQGEESSENGDVIS